MADVGPRYPDDPEPEESGDEYYPVDPLERESRGLPPLPESYPRTTTPPRLVHIAFLLVLGAAVLLVLGFVLMVANQDQIIDRLIEARELEERRAIESGQEILPVSPEEIRQGAPTLLWSLALGGTMIAALMVLFGYKAREGTRSARSALVALTAIVLVFVLGAMTDWLPREFVNLSLMAALVVAIGALVLLFLPQVSEYFPRLPRTRRRWQDYS